MNEGALPEGWARITIEDILLSLESGGRPKGGVRTIKEGIPSIGGEHLLYNGGFDFTEIRYVPNEFYKKMTRGKILKKDVLVVKDGATTGKTSFVSDSFPFSEAAVNEHVFILRVLHDYTESKYLFFWMESPYGQKCVKENFQGTAQGGINSFFVKNSSLPLPPLPEQRAIVSKIEQLFSDLDNGIENFKKAQAQLKLYRQSVLKAACEGKLVPTEAELARAEGRDYEAADVLLARILKERREKWNGKGKYKEAAAPDTSGLSELPKGWCWTNIEKIGEVSGGLTKNSKREKNYQKVPYLRVANVYAGELLLDEVKSIGVDDKEIERVLLKTGDLLVVEGNGSQDQIGRVALWNGIISPCVHQNHIIKVRFNPIEIGKYVLFWLLSINGRKQITNVTSSTSGLYTLSISKVSELLITLPPLAEQRRIVAEVERRLTISDKMEETITESLQKAEALRQSILKKAFEGKLLNERELEKARNASDWEPAEKLLERIKAEKGRVQKNTHRSE